MPRRTIITQKAFFHGLLHLHIEGVHASIEGHGFSNESNAIKFINFAEATISSRPKLFCKKGAFKDFAKFTGNTYAGVSF